MKLLILIPILLSLLNLNFWEKNEITLQQNNLLKGKWKSERIQVQYVVDSHLVHEQEITTEKCTVYDFENTIVRVKYPDGTSAQGTYSLVTEAEEKKIVLHLPSTTTTYLLISITPTHMIWQKDLDDVYYKEGLKQKSAERAIYTEVFKIINTK